MKIGDRVMYYDDCAGKGVGRIVGVPPREEQRSFDWTVESEDSTAEFFYDRIAGYPGKKVRHFVSSALTSLEEPKQQEEYYDIKRTAESLRAQFHKTRLTKEVYFRLEADEALQLIELLEYLGREPSDDKIQER